MKRLFALSFMLLSVLAFANIPSLSPLTNHLRRLPAVITGEVYFAREFEVKNDSTARLKIKPNNNMYFQVTENGFNVNLAESFDFCVKIVGFCKKVNIRSVTWSPEGGFNASINVPNFDIADMIHNRTKRQLEAALEAEYGAKMRAALPVVRRFRQSKDLNQVNQIAQAIGNIFIPPNGPSIEFGGRIGLRFTQPTPNPIPKDSRGRPLRDVPIQLGDYRIGLQHNDSVEANVSFYKSRRGLRLERFQLRSNRGININQGREFAANARIVIDEMNLSADGTQSSIRLGASETILGLAALIEVVRQSGGAPPSTTCHMCTFAELPNFTNQVDMQLRESILNLVRQRRSDLVRAGVSNDTIRQFVANEICATRGLRCQQPCYRLLSAQKQACISRCRTAHNSCVGR
jgi:hypothetical protein